MRSQRLRLVATVEYDATRTARVTDAARYENSNV
jgi:hypothetical protein